MKLAHQEGVQDLTLTFKQRVLFNYRAEASDNNF
jgi:hypothetical protein